ncbi:hypothetical protein CTE05_37840 [Cellulomonas terrae]|uniref:Uncharacterized protein n=1 Tax=Cellulomonas terrae TaxID=311234 RepID=A0A511JQC9_9CELL|nr:hypothetical protein CTE05_37840 [Cellulomonas terrae]
MGPGRRLPGVSRRAGTARRDERRTAGPEPRLLTHPRTVVEAGAPRGALLTRFTRAPHPTVCRTLSASTARTPTRTECERGSVTTGPRSPTVGALPRLTHLTFGRLMGRNASVCGARHAPDPGTASPPDRLP